MPLRGGGKDPEPMSNRVRPDPQITYPCRWLFKIIGTDRVSLEAAVVQIMGQDGVAMQFSNISSGGAYLSFNVEAEVASREHRDEIYAKLTAHPAVKAVL